MGQARCTGHGPRKNPRPSTKTNIRTSRNLLSRLPTEGIRGRCCGPRRIGVIRDSGCGLRRTILLRASVSRGQEAGAVDLVPCHQADEDTDALLGVGWRRTPWPRSISLASNSSRCARSTTRRLAGRAVLFLRGLGLYRLRHHLLRHRPGRAARASHRYRRGDPVHPQGERELRLDESTRPMAAGDVAVLQEGVARDLVNTGTEALEMMGFFSGPAVNQRWDDVMLPGNSRLTGSPNAPE